MEPHTGHSLPAVMTQFSFAHGNKYEFHYHNSCDDGKNIILHPVMLFFSVAGNYSQAHVEREMRNKQ